MRKFVKIFLVIAILMVLFVIDVPYILSVFSIDEKLKNYVVDSINTESENIVSIEQISVGLWTVEARNIRLIGSKESSQFVIKNVKFNYNIFDIIFNPSKPQNSIKEIALVEPKLILGQRTVTSNISTEFGELSDSIKINYINKITSFTGINKIQLSNAKIIFKKHSGELVVLADRLNGWLKSNDRYNITISAQGSIFYGIDNFNLYFDINLLDELIAGRIELVNYDIDNSRFVIDESNLIINKGNLDGRIYVSANTFDLDSLKFNGFLNIKRLDANYGNSIIKDFKSKIITKNNDLTITDCSGKFNNSPFDINAKVKNVLNPEFTGNLSSKRFSLSSLEPYILTKGFNGSAVNIESDFMVSANDTVFNLYVYSDALNYNKEKIENLYVKLEYNSQKIEVKHLDLKYLGYNIQSAGNILISNGDYYYNINAIREFGSHVFFDKLTNRNQCANLNLNGNFINKTVNGNWKYLISSSSDTLFDISGTTKLENNIFTFTKNNLNYEDFLFSIQLSDIFNKPQVNYGYVQNIPFSVFTSRPWIKSMFDDFSIEGILVGSFNNLNTEIRISSINNKESELTLTTKIENILETEKTISGSWEINQFAGSADFTLGIDFLKGKIESENYISGNIDLNLANENQINAQIDLKDFDIGTIFKDDKIDKYGELTGEIKASGNLDSPVVNAQLHGDKFVINDIGYYKFDTHLLLTNSELNLGEFKILLNNNSIMNGTANINLGNDYINAQASGENIDADYIFKSIFGDNYQITGEAEYNFKMVGSYKNPRISAYIDFHDGKLQDISYDNFHIELSDSIIDNSKYFDYKNHLINVENISLIKNGQFHFEGSGTFPLYANGNIDINLLFNGDLLSLIPNWSSFIVDGASLMTIELNLAGTPEKPKILKGIANIERGELWLADVAEHIDELSGRIEILPESNKVNFVNLTAGIDDNKLIINTIHSVKIKDGVELEPWYFKNLDLDFGVLTLSTSKKGIELHIPSLMIENEKGYLSLSGKTKEEEFYFAGPVKHPVVRGSVVLSDSRVTYPFPTRKSKEKDVTEEFLENINWDLIVFAGEDLKYERKIDSFLDQVNTELFINPRGKGLEFTGIINRNMFKANGNLTSERGRLDYLDLNFRVENFGVEFNEFNQEPRVTGRAWTIVRDSVGAIPKTIYLELYAIDPETGQEIQSARWENFRFKLVSADPTVGETQEQVLAYLGYSVENIQNKATEVGGAVTENYLIRPLLRPLERSLERYLGFDLVRFNSSIAKNLFHVSLGNVPGFTNSKTYLYDINASSPYLMLFESSEVTLGKYLSQDLYLTYTGQLVATAIDQSSEYNFNHSIGIEYRFLKNILLEFEYDREMLNYFSTFTDKPYYDDFKIRLRHSFTF